MLIDQVINKIKKIVETQPDLYLIKGTYFNPNAAVDLDAKVDELEDFGIAISSTETESSQGRLISAQIKSINGQQQPLGSILLDGSTIVTKQNLVPYQEIMDFVAKNNVQFDKS